MAKIPKSKVNRFQGLFRKAVNEGMSFHDQMVGVANILFEQGVHPEKMIDSMYKAAEHVGRRQPRPGEIEDIVRWVTRNPTVGGFARRTVKEVRKNQDIINLYASKGSVQKLKSRSGAIPTSAEEIITDLFDENALLHISPNIFKDTIKTRDQWLKDGVNGMQFMCPCEFHTTEKGRLKENVVLPRKYIVFETDDLPANWDGQAGLIDRLAEELPLKMVVSSSSKSYHAWYDASEADEATVKRVHDLVVVLGGDRAVLRPAQMVRFPWGQNEKTNKTQEVIFYA